MAHRQTAARGRRGRAWHMPPGNFAGTLVLRPEGDPAHWALRSFVMSLALFRCLEEVIGRADELSLKWPNDVLLKGGKLAGILLESSAGALLSIGVGVNLSQAPQAKEIEAGALRAVSLADEVDVSIAPDLFLDVLARHYSVAEDQFVTYGFEPIRSAWRARAARIGDVITARTVRETYSGIFEDVDAQGHLVLRGPEGVRTIAAADVYF